MSVEMISTFQAFQCDMIDTWPHPTNMIGCPVMYVIDSAAPT
jgi:hypothetical protein